LCALYGLRGLEDAKLVIADQYFWSWILGSVAWILKSSLTNTSLDTQAGGSPSFSHPARGFVIEAF
jgi:hypothetical protein